MTTVLKNWLAVLPSFGLLPVQVSVGAANRPEEEGIWQRKHAASAQPGAWQHIRQHPAPVWGQRHPSGVPPLAPPAHSSAGSVPRVTCTKWDRVSAMLLKEGRASGLRARHCSNRDCRTGWSPSGEAKVCFWTPTKQMMLAWRRPAQALVPVSISHSSTPNAYTSAACSSRQKP